MNVNILHYSLFGIAGGQEVDRHCIDESSIFYDEDNVALIEI